MRMIRTLASVVAIASVTGACATAPTHTPLMLSSQPVVVIMAAGIMLPDVVVDVTRRAVVAEPHHAALFAATAVRVAPQQEAAIRAAVVQAVPDQADAIRTAMKVALRSLPSRADVKIPKADEILTLVERALR